MPEQVSAAGAEAYVRARWENIIALSDGNTVQIYKSWEFSDKSLVTFAHCSNGWIAVYYFTKQREREIAELQEEIEMLVNFIQDPLAQHYEEQAEVYRRICVRLRAALAELQRGMKGAQ